MAFWSENFANGGLEEPKRQFRFKVEFTGLDSGGNGGTAILWYAKSATKPSFQISSTEHKYLNHTFYYPGSVTWQDVTITLVDPTKPDMAASLAAMVEAAGYAPPANANDLTSLSKAGSASALGSVIVTQVDADGKELESWTLWNAWITELKFGDLSYGTDDLTELSVTLKYDWARLQTSNTEGSIASANSGDNDFFTP
jgi:hypothetical protein|tara:strand:- start:434 stop:1030 length:597 start_codon:yes stop_codon:yes gene_type:complete